MHHAQQNYLTKVNGQKPVFLPSLFPVKVYPVFYIKNRKKRVFVQNTPQTPVKSQHPRAHFCGHFFPKNGQRSSQFGIRNAEEPLRHAA